MINVLLICSQGASTSMMCKKIKQEAEKNGVEMNVKAVAIAVANDYILGSNIILLGPQIHYELKNVQAMAPNLPVEAINMQDYGMMNGKKVLEHALKVLG